jgi:hypothetical protein
MRRFLTLAVIALVASTVAVPAFGANNTPRARQYQPATITSVKKHEVEESPYGGGDNPADAPLRSEVYAYDIAVRTRCGSYVAHYESPYDYLPDAFAANRQIPVRVGKREIAFDLGFRQMRMGVVRHRMNPTANCR